ncbi:hypothetical protein B0H13DRAFT_1884901 [Mycena leptocephala]|nr:hypothetical protein B0H13DRAFT_1884901 [Mycena leptocephala]
MSELPDTPVGLNLHELDTSIGIVFEGYVITMILYGFIFFEVYSYFDRYARDSLGWKSTVGCSIFELRLKPDFENQIAIIFCIDSTALGFLTAALHEYMITQFPLIGVSVNAATKWIPVVRQVKINVAIIFIVQLWVNSVSIFFSALKYIQSCYVFQIWTLGNNRVLAVVIVCVAAWFAVLGTNVASPVAGSGNSSFRARLRISQPLFNSFSQHPFKFLAAPSKHYWMIFFLVTRRVFILSILAMLNSRGSVCGHGNLPPGSSSNTARGTELSDMAFAKLTSAKSQKYQNTLDIHVSRAVEDGMNDSEDPEYSIGEVRHRLEGTLRPDETVAHLVASKWCSE